MRTLLVYGDSNTYGASPIQADGTSFRYGPEIRWPMRLARALHPDWRVIDEGLPGRTTVHDNPFTGAHKNGLSVLPAILESHAPMDAVAVMLGTNDLKARLNLPANEIAEGLKRILLRIRAGACGPDGTQPKLLIIAPAPISEVPPHDEILAGGAEKSRRLAPLFESLAGEMGAAFFDAGSVAAASGVDGVHLSEEAHIALADALLPVIRALAD
ncbi:SGNH/GDSL hydrolase family protein [Rhizobium puerariae]|uniref:SGNH/GDSL hydrolase family protein n=1 Tax=Rhizobium puerariae TaxID=1585791 RepID=A0ABV6AFH1_9HYPH